MVQYVLERRKTMDPNSAWTAILVIGGLIAVILVIRFGARLIATLLVKSVDTVVDRVEKRTSEEK